MNEKMNCKMLLTLMNVDTLKRIESLRNEEKNPVEIARGLGFEMVENNSSIKKTALRLRNSGVKSQKRRGNYV